MSDLRAQQRGLNRDDLRVATALYTHGVKPMPAEGPNAAYIRAQKKVTRWAERLEATHNNDLGQVSEGAIASAAKEFKRTGQKMDPVRLATWANEKDNTDELGRQISAYTAPGLQLACSRPATIVHEERRRGESAQSSERRNLARLDDVQRLSAASGGTTYLAAGDDAWRSVARQAARSKADTGRQEGILEAARNALALQGTPAASGPGRPLRPMSRTGQYDYGKEHRADGSFDREKDFANMVEGFGQSSDIGATPPVTDADMQKARDYFRTTPKGAVRPTPREFLERTQTHALDRQFEELERARGHDDVRKEPVEKVFEWSLMPPKDRKLKYFMQSFTDAWNNPFGALAATVMRPARASPESIAKAKDVADIVHKTIERGSFAPVGVPLAIRPAVASDLNFVNRRVQDDKEYTKQSLKDDFGDVATVIWNVFGIYQNKFQFTPSRNPYLRLGP